MFPVEFQLALFAACCMGMSKAGFSGISMVSVVLFADLYGAEASVGLVLPLLIFADLLAYPSFIAHGTWKPVWRLLGPTLVGLALGWWMLHRIHGVSNGAVKQLIGGCVMLMVVLQVSRRWRPAFFDRCVQSRGFGIAAGVLGGFATMLNAAGPVIQLYLMARKIPKMELVGIGARFFLLVNLIKVPLIANLEWINRASLLENLKLAPAVVVGVFGGRWLIRHVPQVAFEWMIVVFSVLAALKLLIW